VRRIRALPVVSTATFPLRLRSNESARRRRSDSGDRGERATGPRTVEGKSRSSRNADRGGQRRAWREMAKALKTGMRAQRGAVAGAGPAR
jgi:hypothetical protein